MQKKISCINCDDAIPRDRWISRRHAQFIHN